jgi:multidrug resistance efflux pump
MRRVVLVPVLITVALLAIIGGVGYWIFQNYYYYSTDDAQVTGQIVTISAPSAGKISLLSIKQGDTVTEGQKIGSLTVNAANNATNEIDVTSPINGTVVQTGAVQGQNVTPGLSVAQVANLNNDYITAYVDENEINNVKVNQSVDIHIDAFSSTNYTGHVQQIVQATAGQFSLLPSQDNSSGNFTKVAQRIPVIVSLDGNGGNSLLPGMSAEVTIHVH